ncbi:ComF family protein [Microbacterium sp. LWH12-1.2]|uniref:ComF family protein n=1 Tax=Microbacterium sp. LWH12-1.2 TaxID=3135259 RepID=UPI0034328ECD
MPSSVPSPLVPLRAIGAELAALLLAACCAGCDAPGELLCDSCRAQLSPDPREFTTPEGRWVRAALGYDGVAARCIRRLKGDGETLLARPLGDALAGVLTEALADGAVAVPIPTGRAAFRRRGYRVPDLLIRRAGAEPHRLLFAARATVDQRGLGVQERAENVRGSMRVRTRGDGTDVVLVDDVVTTGATFDEASRVLGSAGFRVVAAVALAATPLHRRIIENAPGTRRK